MKITLEAGYYMTNLDKLQKQATNLMNVALGEIRKQDLPDDPTVLDRLMYSQQAPELVQPFGLGKYGYMIEASISFTFTYARTHGYGSGVYGQNADGQY